MMKLFCHCEGRQRRSNHVFEIASLPSVARNDDGFSLLELLVAIGILSAGILVILQAVGFCSRIVGITGDTINALILAKDKLEELQYKERKPLTQLNASEKSGKYLWEYALALNPDLNLYKCELNVTWNRLERNEKLVINTYLRNEK